MKLCFLQSRDNVYCDEIKHTLDCIPLLNKLLRVENHYLGFHKATVLTAGEEREASHFLVKEKIAKHGHGTLLHFVPQIAT